MAQITNLIKYSETGVAPTVNDITKGGFAVDGSNNKVYSNGLNGIFEVTGTKTTIPTVVSAFTNDANYITKSSFVLNGSTLTITM